MTPSTTAGGQDDRDPGRDDQGGVARGAGRGGPPADMSGLAAATAKVGPKGQIVIPKDVRDMFGIVPGDTVLVLADAARGIAVRRLTDEPELIAHLFDRTNPGPGHVNVEGEAR